MSVFFRCDYCGEVTHPTKLYRVVAMTTNTVPRIIIDLHDGELCESCVEAVRAVLPQGHPPTIEGGHDAS